MAKRRGNALKSRPARPQDRPEPASDRLTMPSLAAALGLSMRSLERFQTQGIIAPAEPRRGSRPSLWNVGDVAKRIIAHRAQMTPRDRREQAQAQLLELRYRRESREVLERTTVIRKGIAVAKTVSAHLTSLPSRMVKDGLVPAEHEAAIDGYIRERLDELSRLADEGYLAGDEDGDDQP